MASLASINIKFSADLQQFRSQMQNVNKQLSSVGKNLQNVGAKLSTALTLPLLGLGTVAVKTFADFEDAMAKVNAISGATSEQFKALKNNAQELGATTRFTASEVAALQLNYSKLGFSPDEILQTTKATLDLALATGEDLANSATVAASTLRGFGLEASQTERVVDVMAASFSGSALDLEKFSTAMSVLAPVAKNAGVSLEDATGQLAVLVNAGVDASTAGTGLRNIYLDIAGSGQTLEEALNQIANSTNKNAEAFNLFGKRGATVAAVLADNKQKAKEFGVAFESAGGSAARMAAIMDNTLQGAFFRLKSAFEGVSISLGEQMAPLVGRLTEYITKLLGKFNELSPTTKKWIVILGGIAAAIGPLLALAGTILPAIGTGLTLLTGPIGLIVAGLTAIGVVIYKNWKPIKQTLIDIANYFIDLYNESTVFRVAVEFVVATFKTLWEIGKFVFEGLKSIIGGFIDNFVTGFKTIGKIIKAVFTGNLGEIPAIIKAASKESLGNFKDLTTNLGNDWKNLVDGIKTVTNEGIANVTSRKKIKFLGENVDASEITEQVADATAKGLDQGLTKTPSGGSGFSTPQVSSVNAGLSAEGVTQIESPLSQMVQVLPTQIALVDEQLLTFKAKLVDFNDAATSIMQSAAENFTVGFGNVIAAIATGANPINSIASLLISTIGDLLQQLGKAAIQIGITMKAVKASFANPVAAIAAGIAAIAIGGIIKSFIPKDLQGFADGGIVGGNSFYGDKILARVNSGELILNQRQQRALYSAIQTPQAQDYSFTTRQEIHGDKIILITQRAQKKKDRRS